MCEKERKKERLRKAMKAQEDLKREGGKRGVWEMGESRAILIAEGKTCNLPFCLISAILWVKPRKLWDAPCTLRSTHRPPTLLLWLMPLPLPTHIKVSTSNTLTSRAEGLSFRFMFASLTRTQHMITLTRGGWQHEESKILFKCIMMIL